ncbi:hypothetical protein [Paractinoplanes hotanensis]|uniref:Uncharacterized protein n=1 Tax=Paractinoplanes hotanensis TaxID=2906497 RepID=A0ABT0XW86_9ACTN|nr:hypothetical protein [Actinoplanes hotanensis]MCM4077870.1 hypothetical protein [Actinoplanes hotanensis]
MGNTTETTASGKFPEVADDWDAVLWSPVRTLNSRFSVIGKASQSTGRLPATNRLDGDRSWWPELLARADGAKTSY